MPENGDQQPSGPPDYKIFKSRRGLLSRFRKPDVSSLRDLREKGSKRPEGDQGKGSLPPPPRRHPNAKRVAKWVGIAAAAWILLSFVAFAVSAQLQAFKLSGEAKEALHGNPLMLASAQTILVIGTDARPPDTKEHGETERAPPRRRNASNSRPTATLRMASAKRANSAPTP